MGRGRTCKYQERNTQSQSRLVAPRSTWPDNMDLRKCGSQHRDSASGCGVSVGSASIVCGGAVETWLNTASAV
eukprot:1900267-Pleurochrysis_carterae.AAC.2